MSGHLQWKHVALVILVLVGVTVVFSLESGKPVDTEGIEIDATSVLIMGG